MSDAIKVLPGSIHPTAPDCVNATGARGSAVPKVLTGNGETRPARTSGVASNSSEHRLHHLVRATSAFLWTTRDSNFSIGNCAEWLEFTGQTAEHAQGLGWLEAIHPEDRLRTRAVWQHAVDTKTAYGIEHRVQQRDGCYRSMRGFGLPFLTAGGDVEEWVGHYTALTAPEALERELLEANERFVLATSVTTDGIWDLDCSSNTMWYSTRWADTLGLKAEDKVIAAIDDWFARIHPQDLPAMLELWATLHREERSSFEFEVRFRHEDGAWPWIQGRGICHRGADGTLLRLTGAMRNITAEKATDSLTGLHNRASLLRHAQWRIETSGKQSHHFGLLFLDLDNFKRVNDSLGHQAGDSLLVEVARRLTTVAQTIPGSIVSRLGGDEFVVLLSEVATQDEVLRYAAEMKALLRIPVECKGEQVFLSSSVGVAFGVPGRYTAASKMLEDADVAMYRAKAAGKAQIVVYSEAMREEAIARLHLETDLRRALVSGELEVHYQPKIALYTGEVTGFEALVRWRHPERGLIPPLEFIPLSEQTGVIGPLGRWVATQAINQLARWQRSGIVRAEHTIAINVSTKQFEHDLLEFFLKELQTAGLPERCLVLEITESALMEDTPGMRLMLQKFTDAGIGFDLDDFGTGYSLLSYLHHFPIQSLKIDQSFVKRMNSDPASVSLVASIIGLAMSLKMNVIAEGVETEEQERHLVAMGCKVAQGYLYSAPVSAAQIESMLQRRNRRAA